MTSRASVIAQAGRLLIVGWPDRCVSVDPEERIVYPVTSMAVLMKFSEYQLPTASKELQALALKLAAPALSAPTQ